MQNFVKKTSAEAPSWRQKSVGAKKHFLYYTASSIHEYSRYHLQQLVKASVIFFAKAINLTVNPRSSRRHVIAPHSGGDGLGRTPHIWGAAGQRVRRPLSRGVDSPPKLLEISEGAPLSLPKPLLQHIALEYI